MSSENNLLKESKDYVSVSTRLPKIDAVKLHLICKKHHTSPSKYIRDLIQKNVNSPQKKFLSGKNKIKYDKVKNKFSWVVELDSEKEVLVLDNLSDNFLKNLNTEIQDAIKQRNLWIHKNNEESTEIPGDLIGGEE